MSEKLIPSIKDIKEQYNEIVTLLKKLKTKEDVISFEKKYEVAIEINGCDSDRCNDEFINITRIRCDNWKDLQYVTYCIDEDFIYFDVWSNIVCGTFISDTTIDDIEQNYVKGIKWIYEQLMEDCNYNKENYVESKNDINKFIYTLRKNEINYNDMIDIYSIDTDIVEEYEDSNYEWGYGDFNKE